MEKIKSLADLRKMKESLQSGMTLREKSIDPASHIQVKVAMATCGIASGAKEVMETFIDEFAKRNMDAVVTQTGCMGYCYAEPTVEIKKPGSDPVTFGFVNPKKVNQLIDKYIINNELVDGIIPVNYEKV
ncbi:MAG: (2Fe-2S) ferredoxin domain-containing protein [Bacteroidota bacterium]|nr:(2Fe-2S) ferredoxin domain-containing protein [Bacteroidota bacterium]